MSATLKADTEIADPLRGLRLRMIREVEWFLEDRIGRTDRRSVTVAPAGSGWPVRSVVRGSSWYDGRGGKSWLSCGESVLC